MFQAILFNKFDDARLDEIDVRLSEDILTSDVFGAFKYLPGPTLMFAEGVTYVKPLAAIRDEEAVEKLALEISQLVGSEPSAT